MRYTSLLLATCLLACNAEKKEKKGITANESVIPIRSQTLQTQNISQPIKASGIVAPQSEVKLAFKTGGIIEQVYAKEGQTVSRGQLLAKLNLSEIEAQVVQARISLKKADRDLERAKNLYKDSVATLEQFQNATTGQEISATSLKIAEFNQKYSTIYAPISGRVVRQLAEAGELIGVGNPVFLIASTEQAFVVKVGLTDREVVRVRLGDQAEITLDAHPQKRLRCFVSQIAQTASPATGTYEVELQIENLENLTLITGFVAQASITPQDNRTYTTVPASAIVEADGEKGFVFVLRGETVEKVQIRILLITEKSIAIESNLPADAKIVSEGAGYLSDKAKVKEVK